MSFEVHSELRAILSTLASPNGGRVSSRLVGYGFRVGSARRRGSRQRCDYCRLHLGRHIRRCQYHSLRTRMEAKTAIQTRGCDILARRGELCVHFGASFLLTKYKALAIMSSVCLHMSVRHGLGEHITTVSESRLGSMYKVSQENNIQWTKC